MSLQPEDAMSGTNIIFSIERLLDYLLNFILLAGNFLLIFVSIHGGKSAVPKTPFLSWFFFLLKKRKKIGGKKLQFLWNVFFNNQADLVYLLRENAQIMQDY